MTTEGGIRSNRSLASISVGCIAFASNKDLANDKARFVTELEKALSSVENITELRIENTQSEYRDIRSINDPFDRTERFYAHLYNSLLYYKIFIPFKVQDEIGFRCEDESFEVFNFHHYDYLVTYIPGCTLGGGCGGGGTSLALIREYLKAKLVDGPIKVAIVGPSPFHATFWCSKGEGPPELSDVSTVAGIQEYKFSYESEGIGFVSQFMRMYGNTLALYYLLQNLRRGILDCDKDIDRTVSKLLSERETLKEKWEFRKTARREIDKIHRKIIKGKSLKRLISSYLEKAENDRLTYRTTELATHFSDLKRISQEDAYENALSIATVHEGRNRSFYQNSAVLIAGLAGGLIGALLTVMLSLS